MTTTLRTHLDTFSALAEAAPGPAPWSAVHDGGSHGFHVVISGLVHGDEVGSVPAINRVLADLRLGRRSFGGRVTFFLGNPDAGLAGRRFLVRDLNRVFADLDGDAPECRRAAQIRPILETADVYLDLHQTILDTQEPFTIFPWHDGCWKWARILRAARACVTRPANQAFALGNLKCADEIVRDVGKTGFTLELGQMGFTREAEQRAMTAIVNLLAAADRIGSGSATLESEASEAPDLVFYETAHREPFPTRQHALADGFTNFAPVSAGTVLSAPGTPTIVAPIAGRLLFPKYPERDADGNAVGEVPTEIVRVVVEVDGHPTELWR